MPTLTGARVEPLWQVNNQLGEGAFWDQANQRFLWVDILRQRVFVQCNDGYAEFALAVQPSVIWKVDGGCVYLATDQGVGVLRLADGDYRTVVAVEADRADTRSNDGGVAPDGSFWFGTMLRDPVTKGGTIYRVSSDFAVKVIERAVGIPNTFLFPGSGEHALIGDSFDRAIWRYRCREGTWVRFDQWLKKGPDSVGAPDGSVLVDDVTVINAEWDGGRLVAYTMHGEEYDALSLPVSRPTSCALGAGNSRMIYVTSARDGLSATDLEHEPLAGAVFAVYLNEPDGIKR